MAPEIILSDKKTDITETTLYNLFVRKEKSMNFLRLTVKNRHSRRGSYTLELVLVLPIILLLMAVVFQVSVMLLTYQGMQATSSVAVKVAAHGGSVTSIVSAAQTAADGWYFKDLIDTNSVKVYQKASNATTWTSVTDPSLIPAGSYVAVQIKLTGLADASCSKRYWLIPHFTGTSDTEKRDTLVVRSVAMRE